MNDAPIQIRNPEVVRAIRALAEKTGQPLTEAVGVAVKQELRRQKFERDAEFERRLKAIHEVAEKFRDLPIVGPLITDDDIYDEDGMPK